MAGREAWRRPVSQRGHVPPSRPDPVFPAAVPPFPPHRVLLSTRSSRPLPGHLLPSLQVSAPLLPPRGSLRLPPRTPSCHLSPAPCAFPQHMIDIGCANNCVSNQVCSHENRGPRKQGPQLPWSPVPLVPNKRRVTGWTRIRLGGMARMCLECTGAGPAKVTTFR